jgi:hypothetical protein
MYEFNWHDKLQGLRLLDNSPHVRCSNSAAMRRRAVIRPAECALAERKYKKVLALLILQYKFGQRDVPYAHEIAIDVSTKMNMCAHCSQR